jgi:glycosyltransferase involved in cell wall biosynthesis
MNDKILVAICNYNHNRYLYESVKSIQNQSYDNLDICIYDDGSENKEEFNDIISMLDADKRVRVISEKENKGKWFGLNKSIATTDAVLCTSHDADDISLDQRIERQFKSLVGTNSVHNLCSFHHCWNEDDIKKYLNHKLDEKINVIQQKNVYNLVFNGYKTPGINHYYTGDLETAGTSAMFYKQVWDYGIRFNPPSMGIRTILSEDSDFNLRCTMLLNNTSITAEKLYLYRRGTSTNKEEK